MGSMGKRTMTFDEWLKFGEQAGYCSKQFCFTHDPCPTVPSEEDEWDLGGDPCCHVVRLGTEADWEIPILPIPKFSTEGN